VTIYLTPHFICKKAHWYALNRKVGGHLSLAGNSGEEKTLLPLPGFNAG